MILKILLMEVMGYKTRSVQMKNGGAVLCCPETALWVEQWPGDTFPDDKDYLSFFSLPIGYDGYAGLFVPIRTINKYPLATAYNAYKYLPEYKRIFPAAFSTPCNETLTDQALGCVPSNQWCHEGEVAEYFNTTKCINGRYVPPQCVNNPDCQEIIHNEPIWDTGYFEAVVRNLGLNFTLVYVGVLNFLDYAKKLYASGEDFMFYYSGPDPLFSIIPSQIVSLVPTTQECIQSQSRDPSVSGVNCDYPRSHLQKVARQADLKADPDLKHFFTSMQFTDSQMAAFIKAHYLGGGAKNVYNISCDWVKANKDVWRDWIKNTPPESATAIASATSVPLALILGISLPAGFLVIFSVVGMRIFAARNNKFAPKEPPLTLLFTDVQSSTTLWEEFGNAMATAMELHHATIRDVIAENQCYEVKTIGDSFMISCPSVVDGMMVALEIQRRLLAQPWPECIRKWKGDEDEAPGMWNGLRVRIGIHLCMEVEPKLDAITGRYDYYGHDVNVSARVESIADGGQIMMTADTYRALREDADFCTVDGDAHIAVFSDGVELKGVHDKVKVYSITPTELSRRVFKPIEGGRMLSGSEKKDESSKSNDSAESLVELPVGERVLRYIMAALKSDERLRLADKLIQYYRIHVPCAHGQTAVSLARKVITLQHTIGSESFDPQTQISSTKYHAASPAAQLEPVYDNFTDKNDELHT